MAEIQPFRGLRYDLGRVGALADVIAPPYDVIDAGLLAQLQKQHACNVVHVDFPQPAPGDRSEDDRYARAGRLWKDWQRDGVLQQDTARSLYVYHQEFTCEGRRHVRKGVLARVRLEPFSKGVILPHEETFAGPKADRLKLTAATHANLSPVFGLYTDPHSEVQQLLDAAVGQQPPWEAADHLGVVSRVWPVADQHVIAQVAGLLGPKSLLIADGHHRYETCLNYRDQVLGPDAGGVGTEPARFTMMMLVGSGDPGLLVLPTHRLFSGITVDAAMLTRTLSPHFEVSTIGRGPDSAQQAWDRLTIDVNQGGLAFGIRGGEWLLAKPMNFDVMAELAGDHTDAWRRLSVSVLHRLVMDRLLGAASAPCAYVHLLQEAVDAQSQGACDLAVLVPPVDVAEVERIALAGERMPQKSTYFYPKLQTGLVFNSLLAN